MHKGKSPADGVTGLDNVIISHVQLQNPNYMMSDCGFRCRGAQHNVGWQASHCTAGMPSARPGQPCEGFAMYLLVLLGILLLKDVRLGKLVEKAPLGARA